MKSIRHLSSLAGSTVLLIVSLQASLQFAQLAAHPNDVAQSPSINILSLPHGGRLLIDGTPLLVTPNAHLGSYYVSPDGRLLAIPILPSGTETLGAGQIAVVNLAQKSIVMQTSGYAAEWLDSSQPNSNILNIDQLYDQPVDSRAASIFQDDYSSVRMMAARRATFVLTMLANESEPQLQVQQIGIRPLAMPEPLQSQNEATAAQLNPTRSSLPLLYPDSIRVIHHADNRCRDVPVDAISTIGFEEYVARVVSSEVPTSWALEALKAQAVAARTYAWYQILEKRPDYDVSDWANFQYMCDAVDERARQATEETAGLYLTAADDSSRHPILAMYSAENSHPTLSNRALSYLQSVPDLYSLARERFGHGYGLSQWGAQRRALDGHRFAQILGSYYTDVYLRNAISPTQVIADFIIPLPYEKLSSGSLRWEAITSPPESFAAVEAALSINVMTSRALTHTKIMTRQHFITSSLTLTDSSNLSPTVTLADSVIITESTVVTTKVQFTDIRGIWPMPPQLTDGDAITLSLGARGKFLNKSVVYIKNEPPLQPIISQIAGDDPPIEEGGSAVTVISDIQTSIMGVKETSVALGTSLGWIWQGEELIHTDMSGETVVDLNADEGKAWQASVEQHNKGVWYGPYTPRLRGGMSYRAIFWLKAPLPAKRPMEYRSQWPDDIIARLDVADDFGQIVAGLRDVRYSDLQRQTRNGQFTPVAVDFHLFDTPKGVEFRVAWQGKVSLALDKVQVWTLPSKPSAMAFELDLFLGHGHGERVVAIAGFDGAGNISPSITRTLSAIDSVSPELQEVTIPSEIVSGTQFSALAQARDPFSGLDSLGATLTISNSSTRIENLSIAETFNNPWASQTFVFTMADGLDTGTYEAQVAIQDIAGNRIESATTQINVRPKATFRQYLPIAN